MAHFARLDENNVVVEVIVVANEDVLDANGNESEDVGAAFCSSLIPGNWVQTSYNHRIKKNYAGVGYTYDETRGAFIPPMPTVEGAEFVLDENSCRWIRVRNEG